MAGSEGVGCPLNVGSNHVEDQLELGRGLEALVPGLGRPIVGQVEHQHQQPDTVGDGHLAEQEGVAD